VIFAILPGEGRPALVEHACQNHAVAQTNAKAPGWALRQINKEILSFHNFLVWKYPGWSKSEINPGCVMKVGLYLGSTKLNCLSAFSGDLLNLVFILLSTLPRYVFSILADNAGS
jgi:hypothetical protein